MSKRATAEEEEKLLGCGRREISGGEGEKVGGGIVEERSCRGER